MIINSKPKVPLGTVEGGIAVDAIGQQWCVSISEDEMDQTFFLWTRKSKTATWREVFSLVNHTGKLVESGEFLHVVLNHKQKARSYQLRINEYVYSVPNEVTE